MKKWGISGVTTVTPEEVLFGSSVVVNGEKIEKISDEDSKAILSVNIEEGILLPGLFNAHDHLLGNYYPKVGNGPYENWLPWDNDLKSSPLYAERQQIENRDLYLLGAYRNLVSGVTTVADHMPHFVRNPFAEMLPVRVINDYGIVHSIASFALAWGDEIDIEYQKAVKNDLPFITHVSEGFDAETKTDIRVLDRKGGLGEHSVLVHGLAFSDEDIALIAKKGASTVWCADSNIFMYEKTARVKEWLDAGINVCIGTDSPMSGGLNILYELKFDRDLFKKTYGTDLPDKTLVKMVTENPAKAFRMKKWGQVKAGNIADLTVFRTRHSNPYRSIVMTELEDVLLVVIGGLPVYGDAKFQGLFESLGQPYQEIVLAGQKKIIKGDLQGVLQRISRAVGFKKEFPFLPVEFDI